MKNILLTIEYDGSRFSGWQRQPKQRTVQGELERVLSVLCGQAVQIAGTSRTDAGVHACGQRATLRGEFGIPTERIPLAANHLLAGGKRGAAGDIRILEAKEMPEDFHARFNCVGKTYRYRIYNGNEPDLFQRDYCYWLESPLDAEKMRRGAEFLTGTHDFRCFMAAGGQEPETTVRTIFGFTLEERDAAAGYAGRGARDGREIVFRVTGDGFLYNMVRILTGTLAEIGAGKKSPEEMREIILSKDRRRAGHTAPPQGLYLEKIYYTQEDMLIGMK